MDDRIKPSEIGNMDRKLNNEDILSGVFLRFTRYERDRESARYFCKLYSGDGTPLENLEMEEYQDEISEIRVTNQTFKKFITMIQQGEIARFQTLSMFAMESSVKYQGEDPHYYLQLILNEPGKQVKVSASKRRVPVCSECDTMLLNYSFNWIFQREDLFEKNCPYCRKPLKIQKREPKLVSLEMDYGATGLTLKQTNYQIGVIYQGVSIKLTVKVSAMFNFMLNLQCITQNKVIGPMDIGLDVGRYERYGRYGIYMNKIIPIIVEEIDWRSTVLFPEDLIAF